MNRHYPDLLAAWLEYMQFSDTPIVYQKWAFVSCIAGALERKVWLIKDHDTGWYPNLYVFLVGPAGSGKSTVAETAVSMLQEVEGVDFLADDLNQTTLFHGLAEIGKRKKFQWNGEFYPHSAAMLFSSEASETFVEQHRGGGIIKKLVSLYNGGPLNWSLRHGPARSTRIDGDIKLLNPCINLLACSTASWLITKCITKNDAVGGFGSRILLVVSKDGMKEKIEWENAKQVKDMMLRARIIEDLKVIHELKGSYMSSACFRDAWRECTKKFIDWKSERNRTGLFGDYSQRKMVQLCKLSMIIAASRRNELIIMGKDLIDAWDMLSEIEPAMIEVLSDLELSPDAKAQRDIVDYLRRTQKRQITRAELHRDFRGLYFEELERAIKGLLTIGKLAIIEQTHTRILYQFIDTQ